jgi:hypothetical protein
MPLAAIPLIFEPTLPLEWSAYQQLIGASDKPDRRVRIAAFADRTIRGGFLRWFLAEAVPSAALPIAHVEIERAFITDVVDLDGLNIPYLLRFVACDFGADVRLCDATVVGLDIIGGTAKAFVADRLMAKGSIQLQAPPSDKSHRGPKLSELRLCGADIHGNLDMRGCSLAGVVDAKGVRVSLFADGVTVHGSALLNDGFRALGEVRLDGCIIHRNLNCSGAHLSNPGGYSLSAAGAHIHGSALFSETKEGVIYPEALPFVSEGTLRLEGTTIDGDLDCQAGVFSATAFLPDRINSDATPSIDDLYAIFAPGIRVSADIQFTSTKNAKQFYVQGSIQFISAYAGGDFFCDRAVFDFAGEEPLIADGMTVVGSTFLSEIEANGLLRFTQANLKQGLFITGATFDTAKPCRFWTTSDDDSAAKELGGPACGIYAPDVDVGAGVSWKRITKNANADPTRAQFWLYFPRAKLTSIDDDKSSLEAVDRLELTGCEYGSVAELSDAEVDWRLAVLDRHYASLTVERRYPEIQLFFMRVRARLARIGLRTGTHDRQTLDDLTKRFQPQPYIQLAKTIRAAGYESAARKVLTRLERNRTRYSDIGPIRRSWRWLTDAVLRYGYSPFRPVAYLLIWAAVSALVFQKAYEDNLFVPGKDNEISSAASPATVSPRVGFDALVYAVDTLVPIVDLNQKKNWIVSSAGAQNRPPGERQGWCDAIEDVWRTRPGWNAGSLLIFNTFFGWLLTTLFAAGVTGLLRTGKEE